MTAIHFCLWWVSRTHQLSWANTAYNRYEQLENIKGHMLWRLKWKNIKTRKIYQRDISRGYRHINFIGHHHHHHHYLTCTPCLYKLSKRVKFKITIKCTNYWWVYNLLWSVKFAKELVDTSSFDKMMCSWCVWWLFTWAKPTKTILVCMLCKVYVWIIQKSIKIVCKDY